MLDTYTWPMTDDETRYMRDLPDIVELWRAHSSTGETHYLTAEAGSSGLRAYAYRGTAQLDRVAAPREDVVGVDLERNAVQLEADRA